MKDGWKDVLGFISDILGNNVTNGDLKDMCIFAHIYGLTVKEAVTIVEYYYGEEVL